jgi:hypothetical protein
LLKYHPHYQIGAKLARKQLPLQSFSLVAQGLSKQNLEDEEA